MASEAPVGATANADELRVLVLPFTVADGIAISRLFSTNQIASTICTGMSDLCAAAHAGAGLLIVSEEAVMNGTDELAFCIAGQPLWSDLPIMVLSSASHESVALAAVVARLGNVSVVERPVRTSTLLSLVRSGLRARQRQYQVREYIAEQQQSQSVIREGERRYRSLIENITDYAIFMTDPEGRISSWNSGAEAILGYSTGEVLGQSVAIFAMSGDQSEGDRWIRCKDGSLLFMEGASASVLDDAGRPIGTAHFLKDVTERHRIETEREELLASERAARAEAERASRMKEEFLATLSHELRTPLNAMLGWTTLLRKSRDLSTNVANGLQVIERNARAQSQIIEDLLDMSSIISGKVRLEVQPLDLASVVYATLETVRPAAQARGVHLQVEGDPVACLVRGDPNRLQQVLWNLLTNAVKFTPRDGVITITLARADSQFELVVADTGEGMEADFLPHVFDRFRQADASTARRHGGLGLGLSIVKQLVELHGGSISASSNGRNQGSTFRITLPQLATSAGTEGFGLARLQRTHVIDLATAEESVSRDFSGLVILVVDDEADARALVQRVLEECKATVATAASADEAMRMLLHRAPHLLVSDIGMPGEDGYALIRRIRALSGGSADIPAIALTAYARMEDRAKAIRAGFQMHLAKPVDANELVTMIDSLVRRSAGVA